MKVSVLFPIVVLLFHHTVISEASYIPEETETFETSLFSPPSPLSSSSSSSQSSEPLVSNMVLGTGASPLYTLLNQRKMDLPLSTGTSGGCSYEQLTEKLVQPDMLVTAIKLYIDSFGMEATKSLLTPVLGLPFTDQNTDRKENKGLDSRARIGGDVTSQDVVDQASDFSSQEAFGESFKGAIDIGVNLPHGQVMTGHPGQGNPITSNPLVSSRIVS